MIRLFAICIKKHEIKYLIKRGIAEFIVLMAILVLFVQCQMAPAAAAYLGVHV